MTPSVKRPLILTALSATCTGLLIWLYTSGILPLLRLEDYAHDLRVRHGRKTPVDPRLIFIGIDKDSYEDFLGEDDLKQAPVLKKMCERFPWSREVWAALIERLVQAGAKVVAIDLLFPAPAAGDDALRQVLEKYRDRVVIAVNFTKVTSDRGAVMLRLPPPSGTLMPEPAAGAVVEDDRVGFVNVWPEEGDGVNRRTRYRLGAEECGGLLRPGAVIESLAARSLRKFGRPDTIPSGTEPRLFRYTRPSGFGSRPLPLYTIFLPDHWKNNYQNGEFFRDKIVLVGPAANFFQDEHATPFALPSSQMPGPELHLNFMGAALHGEFLRETTLAQDGILILLAGALALALNFIARGTLLRLATVLVVTAGYGWATLLLYDQANLVVLAVTPLLALNSSSLLCFVYDFVLERMEKRRVRRTLERYVSKDVVKELLDNPQTYFNSLGGVRRAVTVLFSDVRNFTTMTEGSNEAQLVSQLNEYFREMVNPVFQHDGSLDKFIGDAVMAVWGSIVSKGHARDAQNAVATALKMKSSLTRLNESWKARGLPELAIGIGVNHGEVIVGNLGSEEKMELTVIGDAVNLASRLEGLTKEYHIDLLLGETVAPLVREKFLLRTVDLVQVKGKTKPVEVFAVVRERVVGEPDPEWLKLYEEGVRLYRQHEFTRAAAAFQDYLQKQPNDYLSNLYLRRSEALVAHPPGTDWDGVYVMTQK